MERVPTQVQRRQGAVNLHGFGEVQHLCGVVGGRADVLRREHLQLLIRA